jgi:hypothetical protein
MIHINGAKIRNIFDMTTMSGLACQSLGDVSRNLGKVPASTGWFPDVSGKLLQVWGELPHLRDGFPMFGIVSCRCGVDFAKLQNFRGRQSLPLFLQNNYIIKHISQVKPN